MMWMFLIYDVWVIYNFYLGREGVVGSETCLAYCEAWGLVWCFDWDVVLVIFIGFYWRGGRIGDFG